MQKKYFFPLSGDREVNITAINQKEQPAFKTRYASIRDKNWKGNRRNASNP